MISDTENIEKCSFCNKKLKIINFSCKCQGKFCKNCRLPEVHKCTFDYIINGKEELKKINPLICPQKINIL